MNSLYKKDNLLPYVSDDPESKVQPKASIFKPKLNRNGLATAAFIVALCSVVFGFLLIPSALGIALGTGALIVAAKRGLPKKMPILSIVISTVTLILSVVALVWIVSANTPAPKPYIPLAYTMDDNSGIAFKYNPISNIPCDSDGKCAFEVKLFKADNKCSKGGSFTPDMQDLLTRSGVHPETFPFPALKAGEEFTLPLILHSVPNGRLVQQSRYPISCNR